MKSKKALIIVSNIKYKNIVNKRKESPIKKIIDRISPERFNSKLEYKIISESAKGAKNVI